MFLISFVTVVLQLLPSSGALCSQSVPSARDARLTWFTGNRVPPGNWPRGPNTPLGLPATEPTRGGPGSSSDLPPTQPASRERAELLAGEIAPSQLKGRRWWGPSMAWQGWQTALEHPVGAAPLPRRKDELPVGASPALGCCQRGRFSHSVEESSWLSPPTLSQCHSITVPATPN